MVAPEEILWGDLYPLTLEEWNSLMSIDYPGDEPCALAESTSGADIA